MAKLSVDQALLKAKSHAKKGQVEEAQKLYQAVLQAFPKNKRAQQGLAALNKPKQPAATQGPPQDTINQLINLYNEGQLAAVVEQANILTAQYPKAFIIWNILGAANRSLGRTADAAYAFKRVIDLNPTYADGLNNMGNALKDQGKLEEAIAFYNKALSFKPDHADAYNNMGVALKNQGKLDEAIASYNEALSLKPDYAEVFNNMGVALKDQGNLDQAIASLEKALSLRPDYAEAYNNIGNALKDQGKLDEAITSYNKAMSLKPDYAEAHFNMGNAFKDQDKLDEAIASLEKALSLRPDYTEAYNNIGNALKNQGKLDEAIATYNKALSLKPDYAEAHNNAGNALKDQGKLDEAIASYNKALSLKPDYAEAYDNMGLAHLCKGSLEEGFNFCEWRLRKKKRTATPARAKFIWTRDKILKGSQFFVYEEQGLGDIIQFCRYLPLLEQKGAIVNFKVTPKLHALLQTMKSKVHLTASFPNENEIDIEAPLMSLPHLFNTELETIPSAKSYLAADPDKVSKWSNRLSKDRYKIGICWQGSKTNIDVGRSFPLSHFRGISKLSDVELISLHKGDGEDQIRDVDFDVTTFRADFDDGEDAFVDTAAVMINCDLIITSDTAIAHLAGALGCQTWVALKHIPDWRWMLDRSDSPWYPTMTLFRQKTPGDWACVFDAINKNLRILLDQRG